MKRIMSIIAVITLALVCTPTASADGRFVDVSKDSWYYDSVIEAYEQNIMVGISQTQFDPNGIVTREMFVTALARTFDIDVSQYRVQLAYSDATDGSWYAESLKWGKLTGVVYGIGNKQFGIGQPVTREQIATFIMRVVQNNFLELPNSSSAAEPFTDTPSAWAADAVETMRKGGLIHGKGNGRFAPKDYATRAEVAAILLRLKQSRAVMTADFDFDIQNTITDISSNGKHVLVIDGTEVLNCINNCTVTKTEFLGTMVDIEVAYEILNSRFNERTAVYIGNEIQLAIVKEGIIYKEYLYTVDADELKPITDLLKTA